MTELKPLLPCPFCGSPAKTVGDASDSVIVCSNIKCVIAENWFRFDQWNTRPSPSSSGEGMSEEMIEGQWKEWGSNPLFTAEETKLIKLHYPDYVLFRAGILRGFALSRPSPKMDVLEEVRKRIEDMLKTLATQERNTNERIDTAASALEVDGIENELCRIEGQERALDIVLSIITELSKENKV